ncbi:hypothetical protein DWB61_17560 [Ancylomarina euxinus]|uniref:Tetratricopeptide repeat protein n=1 Tax=Ancylomarina euxinus TaxID=2283627 RepID=A0A425XWD0_9BACT|nr:hypothetical protein [Ancylomarina euxinus]MCZ4696469.1 hypothetical protein [Ancylomarina euxinus]MUP16832.1 hypothetical protein [Ancylomarina euxinus]RRG18950.1 hypothetical protein DWB61_17560 [Ancylomarina euxinus]
MIKHLKYCLKEILIVKKILEIENSNFYKRSLARFVAIRTDDFIKLAFTINKASLNQQSIKNDLNTFQQYYKEYFKTQRDKFGAHFQELDFASRLEFWSQIDYEKSDFFSSIPIDIYSKYSTLSDYDSPEIIFSGISEELKEKIKQLNSELDIEKYPNFSSDILSLTRYNSGGLIPCSKLQVKAGVLKSLEIILEYSIELYKISKGNEDILDVIKKILITDLISYCDNFITRTDITPGAKQEEDGLDKLLEGTEFLKAKEIIDEFLNNFKFDEKLNNLRTVRNKSCGHIDINNSITALKTDLDSINFDEIESFYLQIKKTYKKICSEEMVFQAFSLEPKDRAYGIQKLVGIPVKPFEKDSIPETEFLPPNVNDLHNYQTYFNLLDSKEQHEEARHYFWECFSRSNLIEKINFTTKNRFLKSTSSIDYREAHKYFHQILLSNTNSYQDKIKILQLFLECKTSYPDTLLYILLETYNINKEVHPLNLQYIYSFGELCSKVNDNIIDILKTNLIKSDFYLYYNSLLSIYKIEIKSRQNLTIEVKSEASEFSDLIRNEITNSNDFLKIVFSLGFSSELYFSNGYSIYRKPLKSLYLNYFDGVFKTSIKKYLNPIIKNEVDRRSLNKIIKFFNLNRYSTLLGLLGDFLKKKKHNKESEQFRALLYEGIVKYAYNDNNELHNFGVTCFEMKNIDLAVRVSEQIVDSNPSDIKYYYFLLSIYLQDRKYEDRFLKIKTKVLSDFKLDEKATKRFEILNYEE